MLSEIRNQFSLTSGALGTCGRPRKQFPITQMRCRLVFRALSLAAWSLCAGAGYAQTGPEPTLEGFQAFLFNAKTGEFSADILKYPRPELGNVPIGLFASESTLVTVKVRVGPSAAPKALRVHLVATESGTAKFAGKRTAKRNHVVLDRSEPLGPANSDGFTYVGFWLSGTGCREIRLKAQLTGRAGGAPISDVIPFTCYE